MRRKQYLFLFQNGMEGDRQKNLLHMLFCLRVCEVQSSHSSSRIFKLQSMYFVSVQCACKYCFVMCVRCSMIFFCFGCFVLHLMCFHMSSVHRLFISGNFNYCRACRWTKKKREKKNLLKFYCCCRFFSVAAMINDHHFWILSWNR